jgi:hypothetical protein
LCYDFAHKYTLPICPQCNEQRRGNTTRHYAKHVVVCVAIFTLVYVINPLQATYDHLLNAYVLTGVYGGWVFINRYFPRFLWVMSINAIPLYMGIKFIASGIIGFFVTPFVIIYYPVQIVRERMK